MKKCKISITFHARKRLAERLPHLHPNNYNSFVNNARYLGKSIAELRKSDLKAADYLSAKFPCNNSVKIRLYHNCVFVFRGNNHKAHTLITVVNLDDPL